MKMAWFEEIRKIYGMAQRKEREGGNDVFILEAQKGKEITK